MSEYSIENAFSEIEQELINSMLRNYKRHKMWEKEEGFNWTMWQAEQLKSLQKYRLANKDKFKTRFTDINDEIDEMLRKAYMAGGMSQETKILKAIKRGYIPNNIPERINEFISNNKGKSLKEIASDLIARFKGEKVVGFNAEFFKINDRKLNELIKATKNDFEKAEIAMLRRSNDIYRKTIYNSQVYFNTGAGTYEKAVDMATKDFLAKGIDCIEYKNGARVNICDYVSMYLQTANKRAYLQGEGAKRQEWGIHTVIIVNRGGGCPKCTPFQGRVFIDDVWSGGSAKDGDYPLLSSAIAAGLYHPRCKDSHTTYFPGISSEPKPPSKEEQKNSIEIYNNQLKQKYIERQIRKWKRFSEDTLDKDNKIIANTKVKEWEDKLKSHINSYEYLYRDKSREKTDVRSIKDINLTVDKKTFQKYKEILGDEAPKTLEEFQDLKYNNSKKWNELKSDYRYKKMINKRKIVFLSHKNRSLPPTGNPNSISDLVEQDGSVKQRRIYGDNGKWLKDIDTTNHNKPKYHPMGAHKHKYNCENKNPRGKADYFTEEELRQNSDIIKEGDNYNDDRHK